MPTRKGRRRARSLGVAALCAALLSVPAPAGATTPHVGADLRTLYSVYQLSGGIPPCLFRAADLRAALESVPADITAYDPGFSEALNEAALAPAAGCHGHRPAVAAGAGTITASDGSPGPANPVARIPEPRLSGGGPSIPAPLAALAAVALGAIIIFGGSELLGKRRRVIETTD